MPKRQWFAVAACLAVGVGPGFANGPSVNQFDVKNLDIEQGEFEIEDQSDWSVGRPARKFFDDGTGPQFDDNEINRQRHSLEASWSLTDWFKISAGVEFEEGWIDDPADFATATSFQSLKATEIQFEGVVVVVPVKDNGIGLGGFFELQIPRGGQNSNTFSFGPIVEAKSGAWTATGNLSFVKFIGGARDADSGLRDEKWDLAYFTQLKYGVSKSLEFAVEAYGTFDRLGDSGNQSEAAQNIGDLDQHRIGPVVYYTFSPNGHSTMAHGIAKAGKGDDDKPGAKGKDDDGGAVTVGLGYLFGLNDNTPDGTIKLGVEVEF